MAEANAHGGAGTIAVVDRVGNVLAVFAMNGATAGVAVTSQRRGDDGGPGGSRTGSYDL